MDMILNILNKWIRGNSTKGKLASKEEYSKELELDKKQYVRFSFNTKKIKPKTWIIIGQDCQSCQKSKSYNAVVPPHG